MQAFKKILFPVDLSEVSVEIIPCVTTMAKTFQSDLHVLFVARLFKYYDTIYVPPVSIVEFEEKVVAGGKRRLDEFVEEHLKDFCASVVRVIPGDPAEEIVRYIEEEGIDLVVMGTHGRKGLDKVLFGSVANHVVARSSVPVMTVNPHRKKK